MRDQEKQRPPSTIHGTKRVRLDHNRSWANRINSDLCWLQTRIAEVMVVSLGRRLKGEEGETMAVQNMQPKKARQKENEGLQLPSKVVQFLVSMGYTLEALWKKVVVLIEENDEVNVDDFLGTPNPKGELIDLRWSVGEMLGAGSYGAVFSAKDVRNGEEVAIKMELKSEGADLHRENTIYKKLYKYAKYKMGPIGVPRIRFFGTRQDRNVLVMDRLGPSLQALSKTFGCFTDRDVLSIGIHALYRVQAVHEIGYIHRDIKPDNMLVGRKYLQTLYLIDFGLAKRYLLSDGSEHIKCTTVSGLVGTPLFASINTHDGIEQSRRDDLESLGYALVYLHRGFLPWQVIRSKRQDKLRQEVGQFKKNYPLQDLCEFMPVQVFKYLRYVRGLQFAENPDYSQMRALLRSGLKARGQGAKP